MTGDKVHYVANNGVDSFCHLDIRYNAPVLEQTVISICGCWQGTWMGNPIGNDTALVTSLQPTLLEGDGSKLLSGDEVVSEIIRAPWKGSLG